MPENSAQDAGPFAETAPLDLSRRGTEMNNAQMFDRSKAMVADCRTELADLRSEVKAAKSHREKSFDLLSAANAAVVSLEDILYSSNADASRDKWLQLMASKVHAAIDHAEGVVKVYGQMSGIDKLFSKFSAANSAVEKYENCSAELRGLTEQASRLLASLTSMGQSAPMSATSTSTAGATPAALLGQSTGTSAGGPGGISLGKSTGTESYPASPVQQQQQQQAGGGGSGGDTGSENPNTREQSSDPLSETASTQLQFAPSGIDGLAPISSAAIMGSSPSGGISGGGGGALSVSANANAPTNYMKQTGSNVAEVDSRQLRRSSRTDTPKAMVYTPPTEGDTPGFAGRVWLYIGRLFGSDAMLVCDLSSGAQAAIKSARSEGAVGAMHLDFRGILWTGHRSGAVVAWDQFKSIPMCSTRPSSSPVTALTVDETGAVWTGTEKGDVWKLLLEQERAGEGEGVVLDMTLREAGRLMHTGSNKAEKNNVPLDVNGMAMNALAKEKAHEGAVSAIVAAAGKVWTSGGSAAFICMREWKQNGAFVIKHLLKQTGAVTAMMLVSPMVRVISQDGLGRPQVAQTHRAVPPQLASATSVYATGSVMNSPNRSLPVADEVPQTWQLVTGHAGGMIQIWGMVSHVLRPLMRIGQQAPPVTGLALCEPLGLVCSAHSDGRVVFRALPHPKDPAMLTAQLVEKQVKFVDDQNGAFKMTGAIKVSDFAIACLDGGPVGLVTAAFDGSVSFWPATSLRTAAEGFGISLPSPDIPVDQWPFRRLDAHSVQSAIWVPLSHGQDDISMRPGVTAGGNTFEENAARWLIDFSDLEMKGDIGEGAFGTVKLANWNETEVAVKFLTSLEHLGVADVGKAYKDGLDAALANGPAGEAMKTLEREVALMMEMRHPNVILFLGVCKSPPAVITEYCRRGSLYDLLKEAHEDKAIARQLDWSRRLSIAVDSAKGMLYLHSHKPPIIHRDLKSPNLLVDAHWRAKVTDFNLSRLSEAPSVASSVVANNPRWHAPEIICTHEFSLAGDVYAFGLILWELLTWELPFANLSPFQIIVAVGEKGLRPAIPSPGSSLVRGGDFAGFADYVALMEACWAQDPAERPAFDLVIASLRKIAITMSRAAAGQAQASAAAAAALQAVVAEADEETVVATQDEAAGTAAAAGGLGSKDAVVAPRQAPMISSPFDLPTPGAAAVAPGPPPSPFDSAGPPTSPFDSAPAAYAAGPPVPSPFDAPSVPQAAPAATGPPPPMRSPFDDNGTGDPPAAMQIRSDSASEGPHSGSGGPRTAPSSDIQVIDSVMESSGGDGGRMSNKMKSSSSNEPPPVGNYLRKFRDSLSRSSQDRKGAGET